MAHRKPPAPQAISALLRRAGFERSVSTPGRKGSGFASARRWSDGFSVIGAGATVRVWQFGGSRDQQITLLTRCAIFIRARGWHVELSDDPPGAPHLIVTATKEAADAPH